MHSAKIVIESVLKFIAMSAIVCGVFASPAYAAIRFCNNTQNLIEAALGYHESKEWVSEGWWRIEPNQCTRVGHFKKGERLPNQFYYYATARQSLVKNATAVVWSGKFKFCTNIEKAFRVKGSFDCEKMGYQTTGFQVISISNTTHNYTLNFDDKSAVRKTSAP